MKGGIRTSVPATDYKEGVRVLQNSSDLDSLIHDIGDCRFVLLGEASHGTHEYYTWRTAISKRLIQEKGFMAIAVEGDWPDCYKINRFVKSADAEPHRAVDVLRDFGRWPTWMWANWEIAALIEWMHTTNAGRHYNEKIGFYGLDVYSLWESIEAIHNYLDKHDPEASDLSENVLKCFEPFEEEGQNYARSLRGISAGCQKEVVSLLTEIRRRSPLYDHDPEAQLNAEMNAQVIANAEAYYRSMVSMDNHSWNIRDEHMAIALKSIADHLGANSKILVWEHNTHVGDARFTNMKDDGLWNLGQLARERFADDGVYIVGFASYEGSVIAGKSWGAKMEKMSVPPARRGSIEERLHNEMGEDSLLLLRQKKLREKYSDWMPHRAIGVVYRPEYEGGNYVPTLLSSRYDAILYLDSTTALHPIHLQPKGDLTPHTYPFNF